jgi:hypothetical protein
MNVKENYHMYLNKRLRKLIEEYSSLFEITEKLHIDTHEA